MTRRRLLGLMGAAALLPACSRRNDHGAGGGDTTVAQSRSPVAASSWDEPALLASEQGLLEATLTVAPAHVPFGNGTRWALTVNGTTPGPVLRVQPGDHLRLHLENGLDHSTNLHTHGLRVSPSGNADNPFLDIPAGKRFTYDIDIPSNHPGGLFWYHPHLHHRVASQLFAGFFGAIVVEDAFDAAADMRSAHERLILLQDTRIGRNESAVAGASMMEQMQGREGNAVLVNGKLSPVIEATAGVLERWRILNASSSRFFRLQLEGHTLHLIGSDGGRLSQSREMSSLLLVPGERAEVLVQPASPGAYRFSTSAVDRGSTGMGMGRGGANLRPAVELLRMEVSGEKSTPTVPPVLPAIAGDATTPADRARELVLAMQGMNFLIDGRAFDPSRTDVRVKLGTTEEWTVRNTSTMDHPFHLHIWPFQVLAQSNGAPPLGWKDVVNVPAGGWVRLRIPFLDTPGRTVYHCHILDHEDLGMMGVIEVA